MTSDNDAALKLLVIDDESQNLAMINLGLQQEGLEVLTTTDPEVGLTLFLERRPEMVLLDLMMPKINGMDLLERMIEIDPIAEVILITGHYSPESAVNAIRKGAADYLTKPLDLKGLKERVSRLIADYQRRRLAARLDQQLVDTFQFEGIVGRSPIMMDVFAIIRRAAPHFRTALITGDTGTGKELVAHALHRLSPVSNKTFAVCNCSALAETLFESELFGYVRGAFTGATQDKVGLFEYAHQGTVFLDEIGDMPLAGQAKLLRVLQNQEVQRVGSPALRKVDVRVIAATNRDLRALVQEHKFREDLYYRLSMLELALPTLADRREDLPLLERYFVEKFATLYNKPISGLTRRAQALLARHHWPGNIRELQNVLGNACMMVEGSVIDAKDLPQRLRNAPMTDSIGDDALLSMEKVQARHLLRVLERVGGDKRYAAKVLGIGRSTLYNMLATIEPPQKAN